ncbi:hypothetical protein ADK52_09205 [Streptomyces sp. WM6372]|uniref:hypothetical protein n=1 Tax=Streptomyces sp. WM6372 TaxID=1415555 RepID=UPI0006AFA8A8|nr:hypothetical protein [Streptomyces sp. WM6372]KOU26382.1 hypothetical protein ADK52_09205 [Streptomyces sp. WM6372]
MSDHYVEFDADTEATLDTLLAAHQTGLHAAVETALDTRAGLEQVERFTDRPTPALKPAALRPSKAWVYTAPVQGSSALEGVVAAVQAEVEQVHRFIEEMKRHPNRRMTPPQASVNPVTALRLVLRELMRITELLVEERITKESAGTEFAPVEKVLLEQVAGWTLKANQAPRAKRLTYIAKRHSDLRDQFDVRYSATLELRTLVVRLFKDADDPAFELSSP